jgi:hypothetical protein
MQNEFTNEGVTSMDQDEKIKEAQEILNWAIAHLKGSIKCKVNDYKKGNYRVQFFKKDDKPIMPTQISEEWIKGTDMNENLIHNQLQMLLKNLENYQ